MFSGNKYRLHGNAFPAINLNPNTGGERAAAITFLQTIVNKPVELYQTAWNILLESATGITWYNLGRQQAPAIQETLNNNPTLKSALDNAYRVAKSVGETVEDYTTPYLWLAKYGPYIGVALLGLLVYFVFQNPGAIKPEKVSLF